jgi:hypothetical protein
VNPVLAWLLVLLPGMVAGADVDRWYEIEIAGKPCGFHHHAVERDETAVRTRALERFVVARGDRRVEMSQQVLFEESPEGEPIRAEVLVENGGAPISVHYVFSGPTLRVSTTQHGRTVDETIELDDEDWLTPDEVRRFVAARIRAGAREIRYRTVEPADGMQVVDVRSERIGDAVFEHRGRPVDVGRWRTRTSGSPLELLELRADDGTMVHTEVDLGIGPMRLRLVDRDRARAALDQPAPELLHSTVIPVSGMPGQVERLDRARYLVRADGLAEGFSLPDGGAQRVRPRGDGVFEVEVDATRGSRATEAESNDTAYLASSGSITFDDPAVRGFVRGALVDAEGDALARAGVLRRAVRRHMTGRHYGNAFASAAEVVRTGEGDCTEHAVLLAAALRSDGIPARVATGLVHGSLDGGSEAGFAWHMWTQALIDGRWLDLDATRPLEFDAGHLLVTTSALARQGAGDELAALLPLIGRLEIELVELGRGDPKAGGS